MIADQDQSKEKISEGGTFEKPESTSDFESKKTEEGLERENNLEDLSSPENDQEKKNEALEAIRQKGGAGKDDDDDDSDNEEHAAIHIHAKDISEIKDFDQQVDKLVQLAIQKDPFTAMKVARHLDENYVLDQVRDRLVEDETRKMLIERGLLKEI